MVVDSRAKPGFFVENRVWFHFSIGTGWVLAFQNILFSLCRLQRPTLSKHYLVTETLYVKTYVSSNRT